MAAAVIVSSSFSLNPIIQLSEGYRVMVDRYRESHRQPDETGGSSQAYFASDATLHPVSRPVRRGDSYRSSLPTDRVCSLRAVPVWSRPGIAGGRVGCVLRSVQVDVRSVLS